MIELRRARLADAPALAGVHIQSWAESYRGLMPDAALDAMTDQAELERRAQFWHKLLGKGREVVFVAVQGGELVGFASGTTGTFLTSNSLTDEFMADAEVFTLYLLKSAQGQGTGRGLMRVLAAGLAAQGAHSLLLWVLDTISAEWFGERSPPRMRAASRN